MFSDHDDLIGIADGGQTVGDGDTGPILLEKTYPHGNKTHPPELHCCRLLHSSKKHMVTKLASDVVMAPEGYILAKNHMVTKPSASLAVTSLSYILAKNHMVTKRPG